MRLACPSVDGRKTVEFFAGFVAQARQRVVVDAARDRAVLELPGSIDLTQLFLDIRAVAHLHLEARRQSRVKLPPVERFAVEPATGESGGKGGIRNLRAAQILERGQIA